MCQEYRYNRASKTTNIMRMAGNWQHGCYGPARQHYHISMIQRFDVSQLVVGVFLPHALDGMQPPLWHGLVLWHGLLWSSGPSDPNAVAARFMCSALHLQLPVSCCCCRCCYHWSCLWKSCNMGHKKTPTRVSLDWASRLLLLLLLLLQVHNSHGLPLFCSIDSWVSRVCN